MRKRYPPRLITVHGTWDADTDEVGTRWWQVGGALHAKMREILVWDDHTQAPDLVRPFLWSGENSEIARLEAAQRLRIMIVQHAMQFDVHIVAHSHGGNIVRSALSDLREGFYDDHRRAIKSITTVGTPFLTYDVKKSLAWHLIVGGYYFFLLIAGAVMVGFAAMAMAYVSNAIVGQLIAACFFAAAFFLMPLGGVGLLQTAIRFHLVHKLRLAPEIYCDWACLHSKSDEAIVGLSLFASGFKLLRGKTRTLGGPSILNAEMLFAWILVLTAGILSTYAIAIVPTFYLEAFDPALYAAPIALSAAFAAWMFWLITRNELPRRLAALISATVAGGQSAASEVLSRLANAQLASSAYGDDCSAGINGVSLTPWPNVGTPTPCAGQLHVSLEQQIAGSYPKTVAEVRAQISVDDIEGLKFGTLRQLLSWNELAHTAYFRNDAFLETVALRLKDVYTAEAAIPVKYQQRASDLSSDL